MHYDPDLKVRLPPLTLLPLNTIVCFLLLIKLLSQDVNIVATYSDHYGNIRLGRVKMGDLSSSWVLENPGGKKQGSQVPKFNVCSRLVFGFKKI